jgi:periplasmic divalent cation tolerance protein
MSVLIVYSAFPDEASARQAADMLVENRLAACVSILPGVKSVYRWQEKIEASGEALLMIKTTQAAYPRLESRLKGCHPYELPEILAVRAEAGLPGYLEWVEQETARNNK